MKVLIFGGSEKVDSNLAWTFKHVLREYMVQFNKKLKKINKKRGILKVLSNI